MEGRSTWLPQISRDTRCKNIKNIYAICSEYLKTANRANSTSFVRVPKSVSRGLQSPQTSAAVPSNSRGALQHGTSMVILRRRPLDGDVSARVVEVLTHIDCACGVQRQNYDLIVEMPLRPHSGDPSFRDWRCWGCCRKHTTCNTGRITSPQFCNHGELNFLDSEPKCHETARFRFTNRHKTSITRMSMPSGLNGKDALKTPNISKTQISESLITSLFPDPTSLSKGLQSTCSKFEIQFSDIEIQAIVQSKMHETSVQIPSNLLFEPQELTLRNLSLSKQPHPKAHATSRPLR